MKLKSINKFLFDMFGGGTAESIKKQQKATLQAYLKVFEEAEGELILADLMRFAGMNQTSFNKEVSANEIIFLEGKRAVVNYILATVELSEIEFLQKLRASKRVNNDK